MTRDEFKHHMKARVHTPSHGTAQTRGKDKKAVSAEIERLTQEFLANGGQIDNADLRPTKHVDLTFRHYSKAAMTEVDGG